MSWILQVYQYFYSIELERIDTGEKCLGNQKDPWAVGCAYGVTIGKMGAGFDKAAKTGDWMQDPCVRNCGVWRRVRRLRIGRYIGRTKFEINTPTAIVAVRGTTFTIEVADDGTTLVAVLEGEVEVAGKTNLPNTIVRAEQQTTIAPLKQTSEPCEADRKLLAELDMWRENIAKEMDNLEELELPKNAVVELPKGKLNYASL